MSGFILFLFCLFFELQASADPGNTGIQQTVSIFVDPFIGTGGHGHTHPSAVYPFGMIQAGPDTRVSGWDGSSGYYYGDPTIIGFTHSHLSGTGATDRLDFLIMPHIGTAKFQRGEEGSPVGGYRSTYIKERAFPGSYEVMLTDGVGAPEIDVKIAAAPRSAVHSYEFLGKKGEERRVVLDLGHRGGGLWRHEIEVLPASSGSSRKVWGYRYKNGWAKNRRIYFYMEFSEPFTVTYDRPIKSKVASFNFGSQVEQLRVKVAISPVDKIGARNNAAVELGLKTFSDVRADASIEWDKYLSRFTVNGGSEQMTIFYTALYHSLLAPNIYYDVDGRYRGMSRDAPGQIFYDGLEKPYYTIYSMWDTYRALHPFFNLFIPDINQKMLAALLKKYETSGRLPEWELENWDTRIMIGYHAASLIADAYAKGVLGPDFDTELALQALLDSAGENKRGLNEYRMHGYVPHDYAYRGYKESASMTLEYAYDDWAILKFMRDLKANGEFPDHYNFNELEKVFTKRSQNFRNIFDAKTGFFRPRYLDGRFLKPFDPKLITHRQNGFTEANAWQYLWSVPHDIKALSQLVGEGHDERFANRLEQLFKIKPKPGGSSPDVSGLIGLYAHGNEPSHHIPYLFNYVGKPERTQYWVRKIMSKMYRAAPDGLAGNEDCGQMSAWYLLNAMGLYSVTPGESTYQLSSPSFDRISMKLPGGKELVVIAEGGVEGNTYVDVIMWNNKPIVGTTIEHRQLQAGGELRFVMMPKPTQRVQNYTSKK